MSISSRHRNDIWISARKQRHPYNYEIHPAKPYQKALYYHFMDFIDQQNDIIDNAKRLGFEDPPQHKKINSLVYNNNNILSDMSTYRSSSYYKTNLRLNYDLMVCLSPISLDTNNIRKYIDRYGGHVMTPYLVDLEEWTEDYNKQTGRSYPDSEKSSSVQPGGNSKKK
tara:strand:+ start:100 stop:603 length:504 start_codon:yes stop_codon:yes gene_type:complete